MKSKIKELIYNENALTLIIGIISILLISLIFLQSIKADEKIYSAQLIVIDGCDKCFDISQVINLLENQPKLKIKSIKNLDYRSDEAKDLINKYGIKKVPALIVKSRNIKNIIEENKEYAEIFSLGKGYMAFEKAVPYLDLESGNMKGIINFIEIQDPLCEGCGTFSSLLNKLNSAGLKKGNYQIIHSSSENGKKLIEENEIDFLPALLIDKEIKEYWWIFNAIESKLGNKGENYLLKEMVYPYRNLSSGDIKGKVKITYLINQSCQNCFDPVMFGENLQEGGVYLDTEIEIDIASLEGKKIRLDYNITAIPTMILSKEILDYTDRDSLLEKVGTFEEDGSFVFRAIDELNVGYQNLN